MSVHEIKNGKPISFIKAQPPKGSVLGGGGGVPNIHLVITKMVVRSLQHALSARRTSPSSKSLKVLCSSMIAGVDVPITRRQN